MTRRFHAAGSPALYSLLLFACLALPAAAGQTTLRVESTPPGAKIYLGGYFKGLTPLVVTLRNPTAATRVYKVTLQRAGHASWVGTVGLRAGQHKALQARLKPLPALAAQAAPAPSPSPSLSGKVICLDPGHPSETSAGTRGRRITEIHANWQVAQKLKTLLQASGARVVLTKSAEGQKVLNRRRAEIANAAGAALLLRLHCDSAGGPGLAVYYPDRQGTRYGVTGPSKQVIAASRRAAERFYPAAIAALRGKVRGKGLHGDSGTAVGAKQGALTGSIFSRVPVFTVEMVVLTQGVDDDFMSSEAGQRAMANALAAGLAAALR